MGPSTLDMANKALLTTAKGALALTCVKCTRLDFFSAGSEGDARIAAAKSGWRVRLSDKKAICPSCK